MQRCNEFIYARMIKVAFRPHQCVLTGCGTWRNVDPLWKPQGHTISDRRVTFICILEVLICGDYCTALMLNKWSVCQPMGAEVCDLTTHCVGPQVVPAELQGRCTCTDWRRDLSFPQSRRYRWWRQDRFCWYRTLIRCPYLDIFCQKKDTNCSYSVSFLQSSLSWWRNEKATDQQHLPWWNNKAHVDLPLLFSSAYR